MNRHPVWRVLAAAAIMTCPGARAGTIPDPTFEDVATARISDFEAVVSVEKADQGELKKINRDFGLAYRLKSIVMRYKRPDKLRMEGRIGTEPALLVINGPTRYYRVARLGINKKDDLGTAPGKRYSLLELGIVSRADLSTAQGKFLRTEEIDGVLAHVFEVVYKGDDSLKYVLWVDAGTHVVLKREWLDSAGKLRATFRYLDVKEVAPGVWMPTRIEVLNMDGVVAGTTSYSHLKVNQGLSDDLFQIT